MGRVPMVTRDEIEQAFARGLTTEQIIERYGLKYKQVRAVWRAMEALAAEDDARESA